MSIDSDKPSKCVLELAARFRERQARYLAAVKVIVQEQAKLDVIEEEMGHESCDIDVHEPDFHKEVVATPYFSDDGYIRLKLSELVLDVTHMDYLSRCLADIAWAAGIVNGELVDKRNF